MISPLIFHASHKIISFVIIRMDFFSCFARKLFNKNGFFTKLSCFAWNYFIWCNKNGFSRNCHASHEIISFVVIRIDFSQNCHTSHEIISFVVIRMDFFYASHENYLIRMDFSQNYHASHEIILFVIIRMDFSCFNNLTFE